VRAKSRLYIAGIFALWLAGCTPLASVVKNTIVQPLEYCYHVEDCVEMRRNRAVAEEAWVEFQSTCVNDNFSSDFACGFKEGYAIYLFEGQINPPPVPPRCYWRSEYENIEGRIAIQDWFNGYRRGALTARLSGYRELVILPASTELVRKTGASSSNPTAPIPGLKDQVEPLPWMPQTIPNATPVSFQGEAKANGTQADSSTSAPVSWVPFQDLKTGKTVYVKGPDSQPNR
jgi:hypothetical protein